MGRRGGEHDAEVRISWRQRIDQWCRGFLQGDASDCPSRPGKRSACPTISRQQHDGRFRRRQKALLQR